MKATLIVLENAKEELKDAVRWYEEKQQGLGNDLDKEISNKIIQILNYPFRFRITKAYYRQALLKRFPFLIVYRYNKLKQQITITSIFHTSRNPKYKYRK